MQLYKRGKYYWFKFVWNGKRIRESTGVANRRDAETIAFARRTALAKGEVGIRPPKPASSFDQAMKSFLAWSDAEHKAHPRTALRYKISSKALIKKFKKKPLDHITTEDIEAFKTSRAAEKGIRTKRPLRPATVNRELACLRALFNYAIKGESIVRNPVSSVKFLDEQNQQERVLTFTEQATYLAKATSVLRDVAGLILETGMRPEEVYTIERENVDLVKGFLKIAHGKTPAARRRVELTAEAQRILRERLKAVKGCYAFPCERKEDTDERPIPKVNNAHDRAVRDSKVAPFRLYDLRHTWATRAAEAGIDLVTLAAMMGHSRIQMVMRYAHPTQGHQLSAMSKLEAHNTVRAENERRANAKKAKDGKVTPIRLKA